MTALLHTGAIALSLLCVVLSIALSGKVTLRLVVADFLMVSVMIISAFVFNGTLALAGAATLVLIGFIEMALLRREQINSHENPLSWHRPLCLISMAALVVMMVPHVGTVTHEHSHVSGSFLSGAMIFIIMGALVGAVIVSVKTGAHLRVVNSAKRIRLHHGVEAFGMIAGTTLMLTAALAAW